MCQEKMLTLKVNFAHALCHRCSDTMIGRRSCEISKVFRSCVMSTGGIQEGSRLHVDLTCWWPAISAIVLGPLNQCSRSLSWICQHVAPNAKGVHSKGSNKDLWGKRHLLAMQVARILNFSHARSTQAARVEPVSGSIAFTLSVSQSECLSGASQGQRQGCGASTICLQHWWSGCVTATPT